MRRSCLLCTLCVLLPALAVARPQLGVKAGVSFEDVSTKYLDTRNLTGFLLGAGAVAPSHLPVPNYVRLDVLLVQKGWKMETERRDANNQPVERIGSLFRVVELDFIALAEQRIPLGRVTPFVATGPELGFTMDTHYEGPFAPDGSPIPWWSDTNFSWNLGAGVATAAGRRTMSLEMRGSIGLKDMNDGYGLASETFHTRSIQILAGFTF